MSKPKTTDALAFLVEQLAVEKAENIVLRDKVERLVPKLRRSEQRVARARYELRRLVNEVRKYIPDHVPQEIKDMMNGIWRVY